MKDILNKSLQIYTSRSSTILHIFVLCILYFLGLIIPQKNLIEFDQYARWQNDWPTTVKFFEVLELTSLFSSPLVLLSTISFLIVLLIITVKRVKYVLIDFLAAPEVDVSRRIFNGGVSRLLDKESVSLQEICTVLKENGFRIVTAHGVLVGIKNKFTIIGSVLFHISFIFLFIGGLLIFNTRFWGETFILENQHFTGNKNEYRQISRWSDLRTSLPAVNFKIESIEPKFNGYVPDSLRTVISANINGKNVVKSLDVNRPAVLGTSSILITDTDVAPTFVITNINDQVLFHSPVTLHVIRGGEDSFEITEAGYELKVRFLPDYDTDIKGNLFTRSFNIKKPIFIVHVYKNKMLIASGNLTSENDFIEFDGGNRLKYEGISYYGRFIITDEIGGEMLITGFFIAILGLCIKFGWQRKDIYCLEEIGGASVAVYYKKEYFNSNALAELDAIISAVRKK